MQMPPYTDGPWPQQGQLNPSQPLYPPPPPYPQSPPSQPLYLPAAPSQPLYPPPMYPQPTGYLVPVPGYPGYPVLMPQRPSGGAIAAEAILSFFGLYGIGWLMAGKTTVGAILLTAGFVWDILAFAAVLLTGGFGVCLIFPLHLVFIAASTINLSNQRVMP